MTVPPPAALVRSLVDGPSPVTALEWHDEIDSTNRRAAAAAAEGAAEIHVVVADVQTGGRGRLGRRWMAPAGTSLLVSLVVRPPAPVAQWSLLPLLAGLAVAESVAPFAAGTDVAVKWPNDVLIGGAKLAGVLVESAGGAAVVGIGVNVDWRGVERPVDLAGATSLAEAAGAPVDRWRVLAALLGVLGNRYLSWRDDPAAFLDAYRARCATVGRGVRVRQVGAGTDLAGIATAVTDSGALLMRVGDGTSVEVSAGDVEHVRPDPGVS